MPIFFSPPEHAANSNRHSAAYGLADAALCRLGEVRLDGGVIRPPTGGHHRADVALVRAEVLAFQHALVVEPERREGLLDSRGARRRRGRPAPPS